MSVDEIQDTRQSGLETNLEKVFVIIPALNEEASLPLVLDAIPDVRSVTVVDNGSTDQTNRLAVEHGADVISEQQRGYGKACLTGIARVNDLVASDGLEPNEVVVVFLDADFSDHPEQLPMLVEPIQSGDDDFVLGSRLLGKREPGAMPPQSVFGNKLACFLMRLLFGARYTDLGPFRAINLEKLNQLQMIDQNYGWTIEMQIKAKRSGLTTREVPADYRCRIGTSKISGTISGSFKAGYKILATIGRYGILRR